MTLQVLETGFIEDLPWWRRRWYTTYSNGHQTRAFTNRGLRNMTLRALRWNRRWPR